MPVKSWWLSWYHFKGWPDFDLETPWWVSGGTIEPESDTIVAAIRAEDETAAKAKILAAYDTPPPNAVIWRFCNERPEDWTPGKSDRFPMAEWMVWP